MNKILEVGIESDIYVAGRNEDGEFHSESFKVVVLTQGGEIYAHEQSFRVYDNGNDHDLTVRRVERLRAKVQAHLDNGGKLNEELWYFRRTQYGSQAYLDEVAEQTPRQRAGEED